MRGKTMMVTANLGIQDILGDKRDEVLALARQHGVYNVRVFGSVARGEATPDSDVDLLVDGLENAAWGGESIWSARATCTG